MKCRMIAVVIGGALVWGPSCADDPAASAPASEADAGPDGAEPVEAGPEATDAAISTTAVGTACTGATQTKPRGTCPEGLACYPAPGGYCTAACGFADCPAGSLCIGTPKDGPLCARPCNDDHDCRASEGYTCHPQWKACVQWDVSPKLATCSGTAPPRTSFGAVTQLSSDAGPGRYHIEPGAAFDATGNLTTVFMARTDLFDPSTLGASTLPPSGAPNRDRTFTASSKQLFDSWMARDRTGKLHLVWYGHDGFDTNAKIGYATSMDGVTWSAERNVLDPSDCTAPSEECVDKPMIAIGPDPANSAKDVVYVLYGLPSGSVRVLRSVDGGATFTTGPLVDVGIYGDVEVAGDGSVHVVGSKFTSKSNRFGDVANAIAYAVSIDGGKTFSAPTAVEDANEPTPFYFSNPQVAFNASQKKAHVVYAAGTADGAWNIRLATSGDAGATFSRITVNDDAPCANHATPTVAIEPANGKLHVAWIENRGGTGRVAYAACAAGGATCSANESISDAPFASYELVRHSPRWMGEYFALLVEPGGTKLHAVWAQPVAEAAGARARIFHAARGL